jgi:VWFA-related protein
MQTSARFLCLLAILALTTQVSGQQPTFQSSVRLVQVSVVVHDRSGAPVSNLAAGDFKLFEDGKEQPIQVFSVETAGGASTPAAAKAAAAPSHQFSNRVEGAASGGVTVVLFDRLNTRFEDQLQARDQIMKFLSRIQPTDRVALYVLESTVVTVLHDFTSDAGRLVRTLAKYTGNTSLQLSGGDPKLLPLEKTGDAALDAEAEAFFTKTLEAISNAYTRNRIGSTADGLEAIANHLSGIRGRKNLVWVSSAFPLVINDSVTGSMPSPAAQVREIDRATRAINNANIAVYPVDARGLMGAFAGDPAAKQQVFASLATTHPNMDSMNRIAEATGGKAYFNSNAIGESVRRAMDDSRVSYVLGYYPSHNKWDNKFRELKVTVNRGGLDVRYRKGYIAVSAAAKQNSSARAEAMGDALQSPIEATGIGLTAQVAREPGQSASEGLLVVQVDAAAVTWEKRGDQWEGALDVLVAQSNSGGQYYKSMDTTVALNADDARHAQMLAEGFTLTHKLALRDNADRLHVVIRDVSTRAVGSLIMPAEKIRAIR